MGCQGRDMMAVFEREKQNSSQIFKNEGEFLR